jgi:hypothetical protein
MVLSAAGTVVTARGTHAPSILINFHLIIFSSLNFDRVSVYMFPSPISLGMNAMQLEVTRQLYLQLLSPITEAGERATF